MAVGSGGVNNDLFSRTGSQGAGGDAVSVISEGRRGSRGGRIGMEFETGDMFGSPSSRVQHMQRDTMELLQDGPNPPEEDNVMALMWQMHDARCGASVGSMGKFHIATDCNVASHCSATKVPKVGFWYVPISSRSMWALAVPTVNNELISQDLRDLLTCSRNPETLRAILTEIAEARSRGVDDMLTMQAIRNTTEFGYNGFHPW